MDRLAKKGDRIKARKPAVFKSCGHGTGIGTVIEDQKSGEDTVKWHIDGYIYSPNDYHFAFISGPSPDVEFLDKIQLELGCICNKCNSSNPWAVPNQPDGKYICFECR